MKNLFKNILYYWRPAILLLVLMFLQAACDMSLPQYTQNLIDVGIQNRGIEHVMPVRITEKDYHAAMLAMDDEQKQEWCNGYGVQETEDGIAYRIRTVTGEDELDAIDSRLVRPLVVASQVDKMTSGKTDEEIAAMMQSGASQAEMDPARVSEMLDNIGEQTLMSMAKSYAYDCEARAGVDVNSNQMSFLWRCGFRMLGMALMMTLIGVCISFVASRTGAGIGRDLRRKVFRNVISYSSAEMDDFQTSSLITRATNDIQQVQMTSTMLMRMLLYAPVLCIWGIYKVAQTKAHMNWVIIVGVIAIVTLIMILMVLAMPKFKQMQKLIDNLNGVSREILTGLSVIRAFGRQEEEEKRFDKANSKLKRTQLFTNRVMAFMQPSMMIIMNGLVVLITWVAANRIDSGDMQVGEMTAFITYSMIIVSSFMMLTVMSILLPRAGVAADRIAEVISTKSSIVDREDAVDEEIKEGVVEFRDVCFKYPDAEENVLEGLNFIARPGETTAIIGATGTGKSTLINLIPRFYDVSEGQILIDGRDIRDYTLKSLRDAIGLVPQKGVLFTGTIESNFKFGRPEATEDELREAAEIAQAMEFIDEKEDGFASFIAQNGSNVSGGQRQRLSIARALIKKPRILVFDDSFSALDMKTDANLRKALAEKANDATRIIVAQRVGTILHANQILVLDEGRIVGKGTHEELLDTCDVYRQIAESQLSKSELGGK